MIKKEEKELTRLSFFGFEIRSPERAMGKRGWVCTWASAHARARERKRNGMFEVGSERGFIEEEEEGKSVRHNTSWVRASVIKRGMGTSGQVDMDTHPSHLLFLIILNIY